LPPLPDIPEPLRGRDLVLVEAAHLGDASAGASLIHPLRRLGPELDTFGSIPAPALGQLHMDPDQPVLAAGDGVLLADALAAAIDTLVALTGVATVLDSVRDRFVAPAVPGRPRSAGTRTCRSHCCRPTSHASDTTSSTDATVPSSARTWFHAGHCRRYVRQYDVPSSLAGSTASSLLFIGTFTTMVSTNTPTT
jgi:hypothetical protein